MSKKTLNEATVRQFMKLVNHNKSTINSFISENYTNEEEKMEEVAEATNEEKMEEGAYEEEVSEMAPMEEEPMAEKEDEEMPPVGDEMPPADLDADPAGGMGELDVPKDLAMAVIEFADLLKGVMDMDDMDDEGDDGEMPDVPAPAEPEGDDEAPMMEEEEAANEGEMNEDEQMVQEVARRVAARILKAKRAKKDLDQALGK